MENKYEKKVNKVVALALDYDSCASILAYPCFYPDHLALQDKHKNKLISKGIRDAFKDILKRYTEGADKILLYVGSTRQTPFIDQLNEMRNNNGSCYVTYANLAKKYGWEFSPMLYHDNVNGLDEPWEIPLTPGTIMGELFTDINGNFIDYTSDYEGLALPIKEDKIDIIRYHLIDLNRRYGLDKTTQVEYVFIDDLAEIIDTNRRHFRKHHDQIPRHVNFNLVHFDWFPIAIEYMNDTSANISALDEKDNAYQKAVCSRMLTTVTTSQGIFKQDSVHLSDEDDSDSVKSLGTLSINSVFAQPTLSRKVEQQQYDSSRCVLACIPR